MAGSSFEGLFDPNNPSTPKDYGSAPDIPMIGGTAIAVAAMSICICQQEK